jgi:hypothetical protein
LCSLLNCFQWHRSIFWQLQFKRKTFKPNIFLHLLTTTVAFHSQNSKVAVYTHQIQLNIHADYFFKLLFGKVSCSHLLQLFSSTGIAEYSLALSSDHTVLFYSQKINSNNFPSCGKKEINRFYLPSAWTVSLELHSSISCTWPPVTEVDFMDTGLLSDAMEGHFSSLFSLFSSYARIDWSF